MILIAFILSVLVGMVLAAVIVGLAGVLFLDTGFVDAWQAAWNRPGWLLLFAIIAAILLGTSRD